MIPGIAPLGDVPAQFKTSANKPHTDMHDVAAEAIDALIAGATSSDAFDDESTGVIFSRQTSGHPFPWFIITADRRVFILDGQTDPATIRASAGPERNAKVVVQGEGTASTVLALLASSTDANGSLHPLMSLADKGNALIWYLLNAGGENLNDFISTTMGVFGPKRWSADIYGYTMQRGSASFAHAGPPGNALDHDTAAAEVFNGSRSASTGTWGSDLGVTAITSVTNSAAGVASIDTNPGESSHVFQLKTIAGTNLVASTGWDSTSHTHTVAKCVPCAPGNYVKGVISLKAQTTTRTVTPFLVFVNSAGATIAGTITGPAVSVTAGGFAKLAVGGVVPANAAGCYLQVGAAVATNEIQWAAGAGIWVNTATSAATDPNANAVYSPPFCPQNDGTGYSSGRTGDDYKQTDETGTTGRRMYVLDGAAGALYVPRLVGAPGSPAAPRWLSVA